MTLKAMGFPSDFVSQKEKESKEYGAQMAKAIYSNFISSNSDYEEKVRRFMDNRRYAEGLQSMEKYKSQMSIKDDVYLNIDWSVISIIPVFVDLMVGEILNSEFKIVANAIDSMSITEKDKERAKLIARMKLKDFDQYMKDNGLTGQISDLDYVPANMDEIELHMDMNHKLATEITMEEFIKFIFKFNDDTELKRKIYRDIITLKTGVAKCFINEYDEVELRYVDPVNFITSYSRKDDYSDAKFAAELMYVDIAELRRMGKGELTEECLFDIAKAAGKDEWRFGSNYASYYNEYGDNYFGYDDFLIPVLDFQFISTDIKTFEEKPNNYGGFYFNEKSHNYKTEDPNRKIYKKELEFKYGGYWCMGADKIFGYGMKHDIVRRKKSGIYSPECDLDYIVYSPNKYDMENKSLVERMIPHADQIQLASNKMQHLMMKMKPAGLAIDIGAMQDIILGKLGSADPLDLINLYEQQGVMFYNSLDENGVPSNRPPIAEIKNVMGTALQELQSVYSFHQQKIREITGINEMRDGNSVSEDISYKTQQQALQASRNATKELNNSFLNIWERMARRCSDFVSYLIEGDRIDAYKNVLGSVSVDLLKLNKDMPMSEFGIYFEALPDASERDLIEQNIQISLKNGEIRPEDAMSVREVSKTSVKKAVQYLKLRRKQYQKELSEKSKQEQEQNAMLQQQSAEAKHQMVMQEQQMKMKEIELKMQMEDKNNQQQHLRKMEQIKLEGQIKSGHIEQASDEDFKKTALSDAVKQPRLFEGDPTV